MKKMIQNNKGITLIALVVTIIVLLVLSGTVISMITGNDGILTQAQETKFKSELSSLKDEYMLFINNKKLEAPTKFKEESVWASKNSLTYNTKTEENGNIEDILPSISKSLKDKIEIVKGEILIKTQNEREVEWAQEIGVGVNPYEITEDGVLVSSNGNLELIDENGTLELPETIKEIGEGAFSSAESLKSIIIPESVKIIGANAFSNNTTLEKVIIKEGVEKIEDDAFKNCTNLKEITFSESITIIGKEVFLGCTNLEEIKLPDNLKVLETQLFRDCYNLKNITLPSNLEEISEYAFWNCGEIEEISISSTVNKIHAKSFSGCKKLTKINIDSNNTEFTYNNGMLMKKDGSEIAFIADSILNNLTEFEIPNGIINFNTNISSYTNIEKIILPASLTSIGSVAMFPSSIENIEVKEGNITFCVDNDSLYSIDKKRLVACYSKEEEITVIDNVEIIGEYCFKFATNVKNIFLSDYVKRIERYAVSSLSNFEHLTIGKNVSYIDSLFKGTNYNGIVNIDEDNTSYTIENNILYSKDKKKIIKIMYKINGEFIVDSTVEEIESHTFYLQNGMTKITLNEGIKNIKTSAFTSCTNLTSIEIPSTIESIGNTAFDACNKLSEIIINKPEGSISGAPWGCSIGIRAVKWNG